MSTLNLRLTMIAFSLLLYSVVWLVWTAWKQRRARHISAANSIAPYLDVLTSAPIALFLLNGKRIMYSNRHGASLLARQKLTEDQLLKVLPKRTEGKSVVCKSLSLADGMVSVWVGNIDTERQIIVLEEKKSVHREQERLQFWGSVSHELRTPITSVIAHLEVAQSGDVPPKNLSASLDIALKEARRVSWMVQGVLELSRLSIAPLEMRPVNVVLLAEEAVSSLIFLAQSQQITLKLNYPPNIPPVLGNPDKLKQVFTNLIDNAIKYCDKGDMIEVKLLSEGSGVMCAVCDTGPGIDAEHLPRLTEQFFRVRRDVSGSGLGLAIVSEIVRQHNSFLEVDSVKEGTEIENETIFSFILPYGAEDITEL